ncbi:hypothetical protein ABT301_19700 [Streptomyces sp. NPDC000987]|uniref:hypothetical protein n=1 Tax=Streptomyces sp. NPDC000987 TaxID=3154374 RepID=UPI00332DA11C
MDVDTHLRQAVRPAFAITLDCVTVPERWELGPGLRRGRLRPGERRGAERLMMD